jgi:tetratricopeptide (TPR) repeat protein
MNRNPGRILVAISITLAAHAQTPAPPAGGSIAVVGIEAAASVDAREAWIATAVEETLTWRLRRVGTLTIVPTIRCQQARRELRDSPTSPLAEWPRVLKLLGAARQVRGTFEGHVDNVTLKLECIDLAGGATQSGTLGPARLFEVIDQATRWVLQTAGVSRLSETVERTVMAPPCQTPSALEYFAKSLAAVHAEKGRDALYYANRAAEYDNRFRAAQLHLALLEIKLDGSARATASMRLRRFADDARRGQDAFDIAEAEHAQGMLMLAAGSYDSARIRFESALEAAQRSGDVYSEIGALNSIADALMGQSGPQPGDAAETARLEQAAARQAQLVALLDRLGDVIGLAPATLKMALILEGLGQADKAMEMHQRTLAAAQAAGSRRGQATAHMLIGQAHLRAGRRDDAVKSTNLCLELADAESRTAARLTLAEIYQDPTAPLLSEALVQYEQALKELQSGSDLARQMRCLRGLARVRYKLGQPGPARAAMQEAVDIAYALQSTDQAALQKELAEMK